jgi:arabinogalactan oligomer / maltooligosaccharide transport system permease protein
MTAAVTEIRATGASASRRPRRNRIPYVYLAPAFLVMGVITLYPLIYQVWMSFTDFGIQNLRSGSAAPAWVGIQNYVDVLSSQLSIPNYYFVRLLLYNLVWAFANVTIHVILGVGIALLVHTKGLWFKRFYRSLFILPVVIPPIIVATVWKNMFDADHGAINQLLALAGGVVGLPASLFGADWLRQVEDPVSFVPLPLAFYAMLVTNTWLGWPLNAVVATGALQSIPGELYEAAEIDGAGRWQQFKNVTLVFLRPAMVPYAIYGFVITFNLFHLAYFMSQGGPQGRTELLVTQAYRLVNDQQLYGVGASFAVIMFFVLLAITLVTNKAAKATASYQDQ